MKKTSKDDPSAPPKVSKRARATQAAKRWMKTFKELRESKAYYEKIRDFKPHVFIELETDDFLVTTAQSSEELMRILELRHEIFVLEWQGRKAFHGLDVDNYDFEGDHLMIIDKRADKVVGTYRLLCSKFTQNFYSDSEFDLATFIQSPKVKLEMGRACVHQDYRDGNTIDLLWKGLSAFIRKENINYLFGCSSVKTTDAVFSAQLINYFNEREVWSDEYHIRPREKYAFEQFDPSATTALPVSEARDVLPPLLRSYLNAGANVYGWPAYDRDFACIDLLTILDLSRLNKKFQARYLEGFEIGPDQTDR